jgi:hypothetical protein
VRFREGKKGPTTTTRRKFFLGKMKENSTCKTSRHAELDRTLSGAGMTLASSLAGSAMLVVALEVVSKRSLKKRRGGKLAISAKPQALDRSRGLLMVSDLSQGTTFFAFTVLIINKNEFKMAKNQLLFPARNLLAMLCQNVSYWTLSWHSNGRAFLFTRTTYPDAPTICTKSIKSSLSTAPLLPSLSSGGLQIQRCTRQSFASESPRHLP